MQIKIYKKAFTLAEVLITLGIIGVVAALTIPILINSSNNTQAVSAVKKYQSVLANAINQYEADNGCVGDLSICDAFNWNAGMGQTKAWNALKGYFNLGKDCGTGTGCFSPGVTYKYLNTSLAAPGIIDNFGIAKGILADGTLIALQDNGQSCTQDQTASHTGPFSKCCASITIDINGKTGPNQVGRDTFAFEITSKGVFPFGHPDQFGYTPNCDPSGAAPSGTGNGCTQRIINESAITY